MSKNLDVNVDNAGLKCFKAWVLVRFSYCMKLHENGYDLDNYYDGLVLIVS